MSEIRFSSLRPLTEAEEAEIQREIADDPDAPEATDEELAQARPFAEVFPELSAKIRAARGRPPVEHPKEKVTIRLSHDVVAHFRATGPGWQGRIDEALKKAAGLR
jgi:uncharacterized protein (DUF4415 family)